MGFSTSMPAAFSMPAPTTSLGSAVVPSSNFPRGICSAVLMRLTAVYCSSTPFTETMVCNAPLSTAFSSATKLTTATPFVRLSCAIRSAEK